MNIRRFIPLVLACSAMFVSCDVHEFPEPPESRPHVIRLDYETDLPVWHNDYSLSEGVTSRGEVPTKSVMNKGHMRYIIRTFPKGRDGRPSFLHAQEFTFVRDLSMGYDNEFTLDLIPGDYRIMVWSDLLESEDDDPFHNHADFQQIKLHGEHRGNTDYRDAFRGFADFKMMESIAEEVADTTDIEMIRPLAKFEFVSDDLSDFVTKETMYAISKAEKENAGTKVDPDSKVVNLADYYVEVIYSGFMPDTYNMFTDKPVDSATGVRFRSQITKISEQEASMGFDYVFVGDRQSAVTVQFAIYNKDNEEISRTVSVDVPLKRGYHTVLRGSFLMQKASGGIGIDPSFENDYNIIL